GRFEPGLIDGLPGPARFVVTHAIAPGTPLAWSARLKMHGEIKLGNWSPFRAEEVVTAGGSLVWAAVVSAKGLPIRGSDQVATGRGSSTWKVLDLFSVMRASGDDVTRSGAGRLHGELVAWLPTSLPFDAASWQEAGPGQLHVRMKTTAVTLEFGQHGELKRIWFPRWGNPGGGAFGAANFGVLVDEERTFGGITVPTRIQAGWYLDGSRDLTRFQKEGEFFRATIDAIEFQ
ncbi:MAG TPA: DUF6544 family protein, partial [Bryobacteraceae bacterium]|nr:DUF6544 family protein [Bryobacteraceae bacterium]